MDNKIIDLFNISEHSTKYAKLSNSIISNPGENTVGYTNTNFT